MYLHDYRWNMGVTPHELNVFPQGAQLAVFDGEPPLNEKELATAEQLGKIIGGVYAAKRGQRAERTGTRNDGDDGDDIQSDHQHFVPSPDQHSQSASRD